MRHARRWVVAEHTWHRWRCPENMAASEAVGAGCAAAGLGRPEGGAEIFRNRAAIAVIVAVVALVVSATAFACGPPATVSGDAAASAAPTTAASGPTAAGAATAVPSPDPSEPGAASVGGAVDSPVPVALPSVPGSVHGTVHTAKKGVGAWFGSGVNTALADSGAAWYYTWKPVPDGVSAPGVEFVPMVWSGASVASDTAAAKATGAGVLLGFNEPDNRDQANMSVEEALRWWPLLEATGMRLGSPAVSSDSDATTGWLEQFMLGAAQRGYRVDFIAVHWYGQTFDAGELGRLKDYLTRIHRRYGLPIWLTEYSLINWTSWSAAPMSRLAEFATESVAMLEDLPFVERYAWFGLPASHGWEMTGLYTGTAPTPAGAAYRAAH